MTDRRQTEYRPSIRLARLFRCTSKAGATYFRGRLGAANIVVLKSNETADDGAEIWNVLLSESAPKPAADQRRSEPRPDHQAPLEGLRR